MTADFRPIEASFKSLLDGLSTADTAYKKAVERAERWAKSLRNDDEFGVVGTRIGGSIGKGTAIAPLSDVDLYVYLDFDRWQTRGQLLQPGTVIGRLNDRVRQRLTFEVNNEYARIRKQTHSVGIRFRKEGSIGIDVVPAIVGDRNIEEAWIPRRGADRLYVRTSVERQIRIVEELDTPFRYLRRGIRLLKFWNRNCGGLPSYAIEILGLHAVARGCKKTESGVFLGALQFIADTNMREPVFVEHFFDYDPPRRRACVILDPAMPNNNVGESFNAADGDRLGAAARASLVKLRKAAEFDARGRGDAAAECLSEAFRQDGLFEEES